MQGPLTQLVECLLCKQDVGSSILPGSTTKSLAKAGLLPFLAERIWRRLKCWLGAKMRHE